MTNTDSIREAVETLNASDPLSPIANGSYWPHLPSDDTASFIIRGQLPSPDAAR